MQNTSQGYSRRHLLLSHCALLLTLDSLYRPGWPETSPCLLRARTRKLCYSDWGSFLLSSPSSSRSAFVSSSVLPACLLTSSSSCFWFPSSQLQSSLCSAPSPPFCFLSTGHKWKTSAPWSLARVPQSWFQGPAIPAKTRVLGLGWCLGG